MPFYRLYRVGDRAQAAKDYGRNNRDFRDADGVKPPGRQGRQGALFCAPTLETLERWAETAVKNSDGEFNVVDVPRWELQFVGELPYVYSGVRWSQAAWKKDIVERRTGFKRYWADGVRLDRFLAGDYHRAAFAPDDWYEVLADERDLLKTTPLRHDGVPL